MFCPQCGTESSTGQQYCRLCGANLKVIGKAVTLSEAIARSDRGPLPKIKEMMKSLKVEQVTEEISRAMDQLNTEIVNSSSEAKLEKVQRLRDRREQRAEERRERQRLRERKEKSPEQRRENHIVQGTVSLFSGTGLMIFLYYLTGALVLKLPPHIVNDAPFEIESVVPVAWLVGLVPAMSGLGRIIAGLAIRQSKAGTSVEAAPELVERPPIRIEDARENEGVLYEAPASVTERTTNILHHVAPSRPTSEIEQ